MEPADESISVRAMRLAGALDGPSIMASTSLYKELLFDAVALLFDECNNECMKNNDRVSRFVDKFKMAIPELKSLRVNRLDFESKQVIGKGLFGDVELVVEKHTKDIFAMKVLKKHNLLDQLDIAFFEYERDIMASSNSPFLTQLHYAFQDFQNLYLVMDYHPGGDFANLIEKFNGTLPEETAKFYIAELLLAVKYLHSMGFAHRDIKPDNMMLDRVGHLKLVDFGSSAKLNRDGKINALMHIGNSEYIAPEILLFMQSNSKWVDGYGPQCDMWSIGIVAYEMVTGCTPFSSEQQAVIYSNILNYDNILKYPTSLKVSTPYRQMIESLVCHIDKRFNFGMMLDLEIFSMINFNTLHDQVPPYIPSLVSDNDVSNFPIHKRVRPALNKNDFKKQKQFSGRDLPFVGFTYCRQKSKRYLSYVMTDNPELETSIKINRKKLEDAQVLLQAYENKLAEYDQVFIENKRKMKKMEEEHILLHVDLTSLSSELGRLFKISETSNDKISNIETKQAEIVKNEIDKWKIKTMNELCNIEDLKTLNDDLLTQNNELQLQLTKHQNDIKIYEANEEELNEKMLKLKSKFNQVVWRTKQLNEENNIDNYKITLMNEMKIKEDRFRVEQNKLNTDNECLKKKNAIMEKHIENLNSKVSQYMENELLMVNDHEKMASDFELKLNLLNQEKDDVIKNLHTEISHLQQLSESLISFENHEKSIFAKETESEFTSELKNREQEIKDLKLDFRILQQKQKTNEEIISSLRVYQKDAQNNFKQEITKIQEETNLQIKNKGEELKLLQRKIANLNKTIESLQLNHEKEMSERSILYKELSKTINQSKIWTSEKSVLERQILEFKTKFNNSEAKIKTLQGIITVQDEQLSEFEEVIHSLKNKEKQLIDDIKLKQDQIEKVQFESQETKKMYNKDKNLRLLAESRGKAIESVQDNIEEVDLRLLTNRIHEKNIEIDKMTKQLNEMKSNQRDEKILFFTLQIESEKCIRDLNKVKADFTESISQNQLLKDANVRLNSQLEAMVEDSNVMQNIISKYKNSLIEQKVYYEERAIKADATILQQTKLIDFLHTKLDEITKKKRTLSDLLFSTKHKENIDQKEIELLLSSERSKFNDLATEPYQTQAELNTMKTQGPLSTFLAPTSLNFEATSPVYSKTTPYAKSQPLAFHSFEVTICKRDGFKCSHCRTEIMKWQQISLCQECSVLAHITCSHEIPPNCIMLNEEEKPTVSVLDECQESLKIESWVITWDDTKKIWDRKFAKFEKGVLQILNKKRDTKPFYTLPLSMTSNIVKVVDVAESNDTIFDKTTNEDYEQMLKIEVYNLNTGWMTFFLYIIVSSVTEKHNWLRKISEYLENVECTVESASNHVNKDIIYTFQKGEVITVHCIHKISQSVFLLGADEGLFFIHLKSQNDQIKYNLIPVIGPKLVTDLVFLPKLQLVLMVAESTKELLKCDMRAVLNSELSPTIAVAHVIDKIRNSPTPKCGSPMSELQEINCMTTSHCNELVAVGSDHNITVLKWQNTHFVITKTLKTNVPTKCICFIPTGIVFTTKSFYKIETENFNCKRFFTDPIAKLNNYQPMFICELTNHKEYILCYNVYGVFVDANGKKTRNGEMKWPYYPKSFAFKRPFLIIVSESEISIIKITQSCCVDEDSWSITSTKQPENQVVLNINRPTLLKSNDVCLKNINDYQGTCTIFQLDPSKVTRQLVASNNTLDTLDSQDTCDELEFSITSSMLENLDEEIRENEEKVCINQKRSV